MMKVFKINIPNITSVSIIGDGSDTSVGMYVKTSPPFEEEIEEERGGTARCR